MPKLSTKLLDTVIPLLEAEYRYNSILCDHYQNETLTSFKSMSPTEKITLTVAKADALKDKQFLKRYLKRFSEDLNQQKVLDDLFEELHFALHNLTSLIEDIDKNNKNFPLLNYYVQNQQEFFLGVINLIEPSISDFPKIFRHYNRLTYNPVSTKSGYETDFKAYQAELQKGLDQLEAIYRENYDTVGLQDVANRRATLAHPMQYIAKVAVPLQRDETSEDFELKLHRETFYFLYTLLQDAQKLQRERASLVFTPPPATSLDLSDKTTIPATEKPDEIDLKSKTERLTELSFAPEKPKAEPSAAVSGKPITTDIPTEPKPNNKERERKDKSEQFTTKIKTLATHFPEKGKSTDKDRTDFDHKHRKELLFSEKAKKKAPVPAADQTKETRSTNPIPKGLVKKLEKKRYQDPLSDLFYGNLGKVQIEETMLQSILQLAGGKFDGKREAVRRQLSFKGKLGFVPNSESTVVKAHYHTENRRYASPEILAHYRDFFYRIGLTPHQLWPTQYKEVEYHPTRTTRIYTSPKAKTK